MNRPVASALQESGQSDVAGMQPLPVPRRRSERPRIILIWIDPVGSAMARRILPGQQRNPAGRTHAHGAKIIEPHASGRQPFHLRRAEKFIQRMAHRLSTFIRQKGNRRIHDAHVIDQKHDDVGRWKYLIRYRAARR